MPLTRYYTADDVRALPDDGKRYETVHGDLLVTPAPSGRHQDVLTRLIRIIDGYLAAHGNSDLMVSPADLAFGADSMVQPDLFVADLAVFHHSGKWADIRTVHLLIEIVSPATGNIDRTTKRDLYQEQRIPEYWVVDIDQRHLEVWTPDAAFPVVERERLQWRHPAIAETCVVDVATLLRFD